MINTINSFVTVYSILCPKKLDHNINCYNMCNNMLQQSGDKKLFNRITSNNKNSFLTDVFFHNCYLFNPLALHVCTVMLILLVLTVNSIYRVDQKLTSHVSNTTQDMYQSEYLRIVLSILYIFINKLYYHTFQHFVEYPVRIYFHWPTL